MKRRLPFHSNAVWPPPALIGMFIAFYGTLEAGLWLLQLRMPYAAESLSDLPEFRSIRSTALAFAAGVYALFRLWRFHPACSPAYAAWLQSTPWTACRPLPLGPLHPVWQDAVVVGALMAIAVWHAHVDPLLPAGVFALAYLVGLTLLLALTRRRWHCFLLGVLWPALVLPGNEGLPRLFILAAIGGVVWLGSRQSIRTFPWNSLVGGVKPTSSLLQMDIRIDLAPLGNKLQLGAGWPVRVLGPGVHHHPIKDTTSLALGILAGWWRHCLIQCGKIEPAAGGILLFAVFAAAFRLAIYCNGIAPPFNLWGRIVTGRFVLPGFDKVLLTPAVVVCIATVGGMIIRRSGAWYPVAESSVIGMASFALLSGGPTLRSWLLTGQHRFLPPTKFNANQQKLLSV